MVNRRRRKPFFGFFGLSRLSRKNRKTVYGGSNLFSEHHKRSGWRNCPRVHAPRIWGRVPWDSSSGRELILRENSRPRPRESVVVVVSSTSSDHTTTNRGGDVIDIDLVLSSTGSCPRPALFETKMLKTARFYVYGTNCSGVCGINYIFVIISHPCARGPDHTAPVDLCLC